MNHCENQQILNCIISELEFLKQCIKELEERLRGLEKNDDEH